MATFITQARFTKDCLNGMVAATQDRMEKIGRLVGDVGGKLVTYFLTSGDYDVLLIVEAPSFADLAPALLVAAGEGGLADLKTVTALKSDEIQNVLAKAESIRDRNVVAGAVSAEARAVSPSADPGGEAATNESPDETKTAADVLDARKKAVDDIQAGRPAPYYFAR
jgi:uncharacterized protein with GYD domain